MGKNKFKLSDMIPNAWFYKLRDMGKNNTYRNKKHLNTPSTSSSLSNSSSLISSSISTSSNSISVLPKNQTPQISHHRQSYYFTRELSPEESKFPVLEPKLPNSPMKSPKQRIPSRIPQTNSKSVKPNFNTKLQNSPNESPTKRLRNKVLCNKPNSQVPISSAFVDSNFKNLDDNTNGFYSIYKSKLPPIITKKKTEVKKEKKINAPRKQRSTPVSKHSVIPTGVRLRSSSPRIGKISESGRKSFSSGRRRRLPESFAVVKSSSDPKKDFRESMVEMILQNNINSSKELEDLLACYLQLNCDEYHEMIIKVFKQIWFEIANVRAQ